MAKLAISASFEYLCYGSAIIRNILILSVRRSNLQSDSDVHKGTSDSDVSTLEGLNYIFTAAHAHRRWWWQTNPVMLDLLFSQTKLDLSRMPAIFTASLPPPKIPDIPRSLPTRDLRSVHGSRFLEASGAGDGSRQVTPDLAGKSRSEIWLNCPRSILCGLCHQTLE